MESLERAGPKGADLQAGFGMFEQGLGELIEKGVAAGHQVRGRDIEARASRWRADAIAELLAAYDHLYLSAREVIRTVAQVKRAYEQGREDDLEELSAAAVHELDMWKEDRERVINLIAKHQLLSEYYARPLLLLDEASVLFVKTMMVIFRASKPPATPVKKPRRAVQSKSDSPNPVVFGWFSRPKGL